MCPLIQELFESCKKNKKRDLESSEKESVAFSFENLVDCPQFRAFVNETLRIAVSLPTSPAHICSDVDIRCIKLKNNDNWIVKKSPHFQDKYNANDIEYDYTICKNWNIMANLAYICTKNKQIWNKDYDPMKMNLNYWLKMKHNNGNSNVNAYKFVNNANSIPFNRGKRDCIGQTLARKELQAFLANMILNYKISAVNNDQNSIRFDYSHAAVSLMDEIPIQIAKRDQSFLN